MNKTLLSIIVGVLVLGGIIWTGSRVDSQISTGALAKSTGTLTVEEANKYDFGSISMAAGDVTHQFKIKNTGNEPVTIQKMYTSCMCTTVELVVGDTQYGPFGMPGHGAVPSIQGVIAPEEEAIVEVVFDPAAHGPAGIGRIQRVITLENNAGQPIQLQFSAVVTP